MGERNRIWQREKLRFYLILGENHEILLNVFIKIKPFTILVFNIH